MQDNFSPSNISLNAQFRHMPRIDSLLQITRNHVNSLNSFVAAGSRCEIVFEQTSSSRQGTVCEVAIRLRIPGQRLFVAHHSAAGESNGTMLATLTAALSDIRRQIMRSRSKKYNRRRPVSKNKHCRIVI